jgi:hypothetical protein
MHAERDPGRDRSAHAAAFDREHQCARRCRCPGDPHGRARTGGCLRELLAAALAGRAMREGKSRMSEPGSMSLTATLVMAAVVLVLIVG